MASHHFYGNENSPTSDKLSIRIAPSVSTTGVNARSRRTAALLQDSPRSTTTNTARDAAARAVVGEDEEQKPSRSRLLSTNASFVACSAFLRRADGGEGSSSSSSSDGSASDENGEGESRRPTAPTAAQNETGEGEEEGAQSNAASSAAFSCSAASGGIEASQKRRSSATRKARKAVMVSDILNLGSFATNATGYRGGARPTIGGSRNLNNGGMGATNSSRCSQQSCRRTTPATSTLSPGQQPAKCPSSADPEGAEGGNADDQNRNHPLLPASTASVANSSQQHHQQTHNERPSLLQSERRDPRRLLDPLLTPMAMDHARMLVGLGLEEEEDSDSSSASSSNAAERREEEGSSGGEDSNANNDGGEEGGSKKRRRKGASDEGHQYRYIGMNGEEALRRDQQKKEKRRRNKLNHTAGLIRSTSANSLSANAISRSTLAMGSPTGVGSSSADFVVIDSLSQALAEEGAAAAAKGAAGSAASGGSPSRGVHPHYRHNNQSLSGGSPSVGLAAVSPSHYYPLNDKGAPEISRLLVRRNDIFRAEEQQIIAGHKRRLAAIQRSRHLRLIELGLASSAARAGVLGALPTSGDDAMGAGLHGNYHHSNKLHGLIPEMAALDSHISAPLFEADEEAENEEIEALVAQINGLTAALGGSGSGAAAASSSAAAAGGISQQQSDGSPSRGGGGSNANTTANSGDCRIVSPTNWNDFSPSENWATMARLGFPTATRADIIEAEFNARAALNAEQNACDTNWNLSLRGVAILGSATHETSESLRRLSRRYGIPSHLRHLMWMTLSGVSLKMDENEGFFKCISEKFGYVSGPSQEVIEKDLERTFPDHPYFAPGEPGVHRLRLILHALCWRNPLLGYCQSFNFIAAILLLVLNDDEGTFFMMCHILEHLLPNDYYSEGLMGIKIDQKVFTLLLEETLPRIAAHFDDIRFDVQAIIPAWLMSLFVNTFPVETLMRVWDYMVTERSAHYSTVPITIALAFMKVHTDAILKTKDPGDMMILLNKLAACDYDGARLVKVAHDFELKPSVLHNHRRKTREEILIETEKRRRARERFDAERRARLQNLALQKAAAASPSPSSALGGNDGPSDVAVGTETPARRRGESGLAPLDGVGGGSASSASGGGGTWEGTLNSNTSNGMAIAGDSASSPAGSPLHGGGNNRHPYGNPPPLFAGGGAGAASSPNLFWHGCRSSATAKRRRQ